MTDLNPQQSFNGSVQAFMPRIHVIEENGREYYDDPVSRLYNEGNVIFLEGVVTEQMSFSVKAQVLNILAKIKKDIESLQGEDDPQPEDLEKIKIKFMISSPGGSISHGLEIYDLMQYAKEEGAIVETINTGSAMSMGSVFLVAGSKGYRKAWPSSQTMLHMASGGSRGNVKDTDTQIFNLKYYNERLKAVFRTHADMSEEQIEYAFDRDTFMSPEQALEWGIIDTIKYPKIESEPNVAKLQKFENKRLDEEFADMRKNQGTSRSYKPA